MCLWSFCKKIFFSTGNTFLPLYPDFYAFQMPFWNFYLFFWLVAQVVYTLFNISTKHKDGIVWDGSSSLLFFCSRAAFFGFPFSAFCSAA